ncbi:MAG: hypothetical protein WC824_13350, partial [Bacteroidota bacterium]
MERSTTLFCLKHAPDRNGNIHSHFYPSPGAVRMCLGGEEDEKEIIRVRVREAKKGETPDQWAWWYNEGGTGKRKEYFSMVYRVRMLVEMCFPYGTEIAEKKGEGLLLPVMVEEIPP